MWQKCEAPWAGGCRVASGNKGKSVVIQLFPRDETGCWEQWRKEDSEKQRYELSLFLAEPSSRNKRGGGPSGLMRPFAWIITVPFLLSLSLSFSLHPLFSSSLHSSFFYRHCSRFHKHPRSRSYTIFLNSRESSSVSAIYARNFIVDFSLSLSLKSNFARPRGKNNVIYSPAPVELPT